MKKKEKKEIIKGEEKRKGIKEKKQKKIKKLPPAFVCRQLVGHIQLTQYQLSRGQGPSAASAGLPVRLTGS